MNEDEHTQAGADAATFVVNASESANRGFVHHCRHAHCDGRDRLFFLRRMLERGWLTTADLDDPKFQVGSHRESKPAPAEQESESGGAHDRGPAALSIGSDAEIARFVVRDLERRHGPVVFSEGAFWRYTGTHWEALPEEALWLAACRYDGALIPRDAGGGRVKLSQTRVKSILALMRPALAREDFFAEPALGINCASGFIRFAEDGRATLVPHSPDHRRRHVLAGRWPAGASEEAKSRSLLARLLEGCFKGDADKAEKIDLLGEVAGVAALGAATRLVEPKALVLKGEAAENGKSEVLNALRALLPEEAVASISPARFGDRTFACHLAGKLLNAPDELSGPDAIASDAFKQIITGEPLTVRDVYKSAFVFRPAAQHVFATNTLPGFQGGMDRGVRRRLMVLTFNRVIPRAERIERIGLRIGQEEPDLLLDWAVRGAGRAIAARRFVEPRSSAEALRDWMCSSDAGSGVAGKRRGRLLRGRVRPGDADAGRLFQVQALGAGRGLRRKEAAEHQRLLPAGGRGGEGRRQEAGQPRAAVRRLGVHGRDGGPAPRTAVRVTHRAIGASQPSH